MVYIMRVCFDLSNAIIEPVHNLVRNRRTQSEPRLRQEHPLSLRRYEHMTTMWTLSLIWLALQVPVAVLIGKSIRFGRVGHEKRRAPARDPRYYPGVVWG